MFFIHASLQPHRADSYHLVSVKMRATQPVGEKNDICCWSCLFCCRRHWFISLLDFLTTKSKQHQDWRQINFVDCVVGRWSHRMKSLLYFLLTSARFCTCLKARCLRTKEKKEFLSSWDHWEQQGSWPELLMPEVGLEGFGVMWRSRARLLVVLLVVSPSHRSVQALRHSGYRQSLGKPVNATRTL